MALVLIAGPTAGLTTPPYAFAAETAQTEKSTGLVLNPLNINAEQAPVPSITEQGDAYTIGATRTATRLDLSPRETPQTTTTLTRRQLEDFKLNSANDALQAGGVNVQRVETDRTYFSVRGFDVSNFQLDGVGLPFSS